MRDGAIDAQGVPQEIISERLVEDVFGLPCVIIPDPVTGTPLIVPRVRPPSIQGGIATKLESASVSGRSLGLSAISRDEDDA